MKEKIKNINFPTLLLLATSIFQIKNIFTYIDMMLKGYFSVFFLLEIVEIICPIVLFVLLFFKEDNKKILSVCSIAFGGVILLGVILPRLTNFTNGSLVELAVGGGLFDIISGIMSGVLLLILGINLKTNKPFTVRYYFLCGLSVFLVVYSSIFMTIVNSMAIIEKLPTVFYILSLWYIPKLYAETELEKNKTKLSSKKFWTIILIVIFAYALFYFARGLANDGSYNDDYDKGYGYTEPYESESFSDYIKRQDPDLYNDIVDRYNSLQ